MLNGLDLFSGIGGLSIALREWVRPIAYCENERYSQAVLLCRMQSGDIARAPIWDDVQTLRGEMLPEKPEIIYGGFPCQDISCANISGKGVDGERSGLIKEIYRLVGEIRPRFIFLENVPNITIRGLGTIVTELASMGYDCRWTILSAGELGAEHLRERWWLLAHTNGEKLRTQPISERWSSQEIQFAPSSNVRRIAWSSTRQIEPCVDGTGDGLPHLTYRDRCLGNAVFPQAAREAFKRLMGVKNS